MDEDRLEKKPCDWGLAIFVATAIAIVGLIILVAYTTVSAESHWIYRGALREGQSLSVTLEKSGTDQQHVYTWTQDTSQTGAVFYAMVEREVRAHLNALNNVPVKTDVSRALNP